MWADGVLWCVWQRRRGDSLNYVRDEAVRESLAQMVTPWEAIEELEPRFAGVTDEAQLKILNGFTGLGRSFITKLEKLGLKTIVPGTSSKASHINWGLWHGDGPRLIGLAGLTGVCRGGLGVRRG